MTRVDSVVANTAHLQSQELLFQDTLDALIPSNEHDVGEGAGRPSYPAQLRTLAQRSW